MIKTYSDDPDVEAAAHEAAAIVRRVLNNLQPADSYDYGGHLLKLDDYGMCTRCTKPIAEAQQAYTHLHIAARAIVDPNAKEHVELAAQYFKHEADIAIIRAELHNGQGSERIVNELLAYVHDRHIHDDYDHSHHGREDHA
ncbi:MAG TPA: hypothetical protein VLE73_06140 [Candidatus Saccharimonadales bacterium]|nr:hypothetical protein [Candidatus Saccharimonadales bacterium]